MFLKKKKMIVKQSSWSGWSEDYKPQEIENEYDIVVNKKYIITNKVLTWQDEEKVEKEVEVLSFVISEVNDNSIKINTNRVLSDNEEGIDLYTKKKEFIITTEKPLELITPTMDQGYIFIFTLIV